MITDFASYEAALRRMEELMDWNPDPDNALAAELGNLALEVEAYEKEMGYVFEDELTVGMVYAHFDGRQRVMPTTQDALLFLTTEVAEVMELDLARRTYKRNHPETKEAWSPERYAEELGDVIYMAIIAGRVEGVDPIQAMRAKMRGNAHA